MSFTQYLKDTQGELRHVAWPTRTQTAVYTVLVAFLSVGVALYLGLFDFLFTSGLSRVLNVLPAVNPVVVTQSTTTPTGLTVTPVSVGTTTK
jgi:preprotein translocase SecE subunit